MSDISITIGSTTKHFNLAVRDGAKQFSTREEPVVPIRALQDIPSYGDLPLDRILAFVQNNWRGGMGQKDRFTILDKYAEGANIDTREPNKLILGPLINTIGAIAATIIGFEFFDNHEYAYSTTVVYKLNTAGDTWDTVLTIAGDTIETMAVYDDYLFVGLTTGKYYFSPIGDANSWTQTTLDNAVAHLFCTAPPFSGTKDLFVLAKRPNELRTSLSALTDAAILRESSITEVHPHGGLVYGDNWTAQSFTPAITHTLATLKLKFGGKVGNPGTVTISIKATDVNGHPTGADLCSATMDGSTIQVAYGLFTIAITSGATLTANTKYAIVVRALTGDASNYFYWYGDDAPGVYAGGAAESSTNGGVAWSTTAGEDRVFYEYSNEEVGSGWIDPPYYIGDDTANITGLAVVNGMLCVWKEDGLYILPSDSRPLALLPEFKQRKDSTNGKYHTTWQGVFYGSVAGDIMEIIPGSVFSIDYMGPLGLSPELIQIGTPKGITSDDKNLYAVFLIGSNYIIYAGRERYDDKYGLRWEWTPYINLSTNACAALRVMQRTSASPKLWFTYGTNVANAILSTAPNSPLGDSAYRFTTQGYLITSYFDAGYDTWLKLFYQLWTIAENLAAGITIIIYYQKDTDSTWNNVLATITSNGVQSVDFTALSGKKFRLKIELNSGTSTITPILREFILRGVLQPEIARTLDFTVILEQSNSRKVSTDLTFLEGGRTATSPITLKDLRFGTTKYITFMSNSPAGIEVMDEVSKQPSFQARIVAQQLNWTPP